MLELLLGGIVLVVLAVASGIDLKTREIPDLLSYGFFAAVIGIRLIFSLDQGWQALLEGLLGAGVFFGLGYLLYLTSQWGGGDTKLMLGIGAALGVSWPLTFSSFFPLFWCLMLILLAGAAYALAYLGVVAVRKWNRVKQELLGALHDAQTAEKAAGVFALVGFLLGFWIPLFWVLAFVPLVLLNLFLFISVMEHTCFFRWVHPDHLEEGDWLAGPVFRAGKTIMNKKTLQKDDILFLQTQGRKVLVKDGVPFVPSFLLGYVAFLLTQHLIGIS